mmetsp:Transcript_82596/g.123954  ORF Transcript_82596/g.123954 Transcript_82596/m.123954 type:complete len:183 (+) Transcript_82596:146-694(+)
MRIQSTATTSLLAVGWTVVTLTTTIRAQELRSGPDSSVHGRRRRRHLESSSSPSKKSCKSCPNPFIETEPLEDEDSGSNDGSFLMHICGMFGRYQGRDCTVNGDPLPDKRLLCPNAYEVSKICESNTVFGSTLEAAVDEEYCIPLFAPLDDEVDRDDCTSMCNNYLEEANGCCDLHCSSSPP